MTKAFVITSITPTEKGEVLVKLVHKSSETFTDELGTKTINHQVTYYRFVDSTTKSVDDIINIDPDKYDIVEREHTLEDGKVVVLKYLYNRK